MEKKFEVLPPTMPNYVRFKVDEVFDIKNFTEQEAYEYADLMRSMFIDHWRKRKSKQS